MFHRSRRFIIGTLERIPLAIVIIGLCGILSLAIATGNWPLSAVIIGVFAYGTMLTFGIKVVTMLWLLGVPTLFGLANNYLDTIPGLTVDRLMFVTIVGMILGRIIFRVAEPLPLDEIERWIGFFLIYMFLSFLTTVGEKNLQEIRVDAAMYINGYLMPFGTYFIARRIGWSDQGLVILMYCLFAVGVFLAVTAVLQIFFGITTFVPDYLDVVHSGIKDDRATGTFASASEYGVVLGALTLCGLCLYRQTNDKLSKVFIVSLLLFLVAGLLLGKTRGPWAGFAVAVLVLFWLDRSVRPPILTGAAIGFAGLIVALPFIVERGLLYGRVLELSPIFNRISLWASGGNMVVHNPVFGMRFGRYSFVNSLPEYITGIGGISGHWATAAAVPHNEFLHIAILLGIPGIALYLIIWALCIRMLRRTLAASEQDSIVWVLSAFGCSVVTIYLVNALIIDYSLGKYVGILVFFILGAIATRAKEKRSG